jgi:hypothetical protein
MKTKQCSRCCLILPIDNFGIRSDRPSGVRSECKNCTKTRYKQWVDDNPEYRQQYYKENKERHYQKNKEWKNANKEKINARRRELRATPEAKMKSKEYKERTKDRDQQYRDNRKHVKKDYALKSNYGISLEEYNLMNQQQGDVCAICKQPETAMWRGRLTRLAVDHDHNTGVVRSLLCSRCNRALGSFDDDPVLLRAAADYLEYHRSLGPIEI